MLKRLLRNRQHSLFQQHIYGIKNCRAVLGIEANLLRIEDEQVVAIYMEEGYLFFKSIRSGSTTVTLINGDREAVIQLFVSLSGAISVEVIPFVGETEIVPVYYRPILGNTMLAIDLKGALKNFLVAHYLMGIEDILLEVDYRSMHPNVLRDSYVGNFVLGNYRNGNEIVNTEEYSLACKIATLAFSEIVIQQGGVNRTIDFKRLLTFVITDYIFINSVNINKNVTTQDFEVLAGAKRDFLERHNQEVCV